MNLNNEVEMLNVFLQITSWFLNARPNKPSPRAFTLGIIFWIILLSLKIPNLFWTLAYMDSQQGHMLTAKMSLLYKTLQGNVSYNACVSRHLYLGRAQPQSVVGCSGGQLITEVVSHPGRSGPAEYTGEKQKSCVQTEEEWFEWDSPGPSNGECKPLEPRMAELRWEEFFNTQAGSNPHSCL